MPGVLDLGLTISNNDVDQPGRGVLKNDAVKPGELQVGPEETVCLGCAGQIGHRSLGHDVDRGRPRHIGPGQGTRGPYQSVLWVRPFNPWWHIFVEILGSKANAANPLPGRSLIQILTPNLSF